MYNRAVFRLVYLKTALFIYMINLYYSCRQTYKDNGMCYEYIWFLNLETQLFLLRHIIE